MTPHWLNLADTERIAVARWQSFGHSPKDLSRCREVLAQDRRGGDGDFLVIQENGKDVATATSLPLTLWARSGAVACQGVAWVGVVKSARRRGAARAAMTEILRMGRQRGFVVTALMPFRVSFYETFGYGIVERRAEWTLPLSLLSGEPGTEWHPLAPADYPTLAALRRRIVESGQCDIERSPAAWDYLRAGENVLTYCNTAGGWVTLAHQAQGTRDSLRISDWGAASFADVLEMLKFLGTLRDQYFSASITLPIDWPINLLLREAQIPHRPVNHDTAEVRSFTRMQLRILDHRKYLSAMRVPASAKASVAIEIAECEGNVSRFLVDVSDGRIEVKPTAASPDFACADLHWAAVATGDLPATRAVQMGLASENKSGSAAALDSVFAGNPPFCHEYF